MLEGASAMECLPCLLRQTVATVQRFSPDPARSAALIQDVLRRLSALDITQPAPALAQQIHRVIRAGLDDTDPYRAIKAESNALALAWAPELRARIQASPDPLATAVLVAIAGNIIDYGIKEDVTHACLDAALTIALTVPLDSATLARFRTALARARSILYLADNAGEIIFDRLLIEQLPREKVTLVVRGAPVLNDVTREDAVAAGLTETVEVIDNGIDLPGTLLEACSPEFRARFETADLVIAKGQGNYETLYRSTRPIYFLFVAKCPAVATAVGREIGMPVFLEAACG
jgi:uncharacterized protein with ATP-grasp and redox domains